MTLLLPAQSHTSENIGMDQRLATVMSVDGSRCILDMAGVPSPASISSHLLRLQPNQRVVALNGGEDGWLVIAAWPNADDDNTFRFDEQSGVLHIEAPRLELSALASVELHCGDARLTLGMDGKIDISGTEVLSSAIGANRIEGATIDLN